MKHIVLLIVILCGFLSTTYAQSDTITLKKRSVGSVYQKNGRSMTMRMLKNELKPDAAATMQLRKGKNAYAVGQGLALAAGALIGYELGGALGGREINPVVIGGGIALACIAIPINLSAQKPIKNAVRTYNANKRRTGSAAYKPDLYLSLSGNQVGITWKF